MELNERKETNNYGDDDFKISIFLFSSQNISPHNVLSPPNILIT
jgi:hypothetical protein